MAEALEGLGAASANVSRQQDKLAKAAFITEVSGQDETRLSETSPSMERTTQSLEALERIEQAAAEKRVTLAYDGITDAAQQAVQ